MSDQSPKGILRNKKEGEYLQSPEDHLDRQEVIRNTQLNAKLNEENKSKGDIIRAKIKEAKQNNNNFLEFEGKHAKWDEINLYKSEQERSATMKIDEPKTPYEGGFDPSGEYYQEDEDDEIPNFQLGESEFSQGHTALDQSLHGSEIIPEDKPENEEDDEEEPQEPSLTAEERHKRFEEKRKNHYHMKGNVLHEKIQISDDDEN